MAEMFPSTLQDKVNEAGFQLKTGKTTITSNMDIPPNKKRRRFTKGIDNFTTTFNIDYDDYTTLYEFFDTTLAGGTKTFLYNHPMTGVESEFRMAEPTYRPLGGRSFRVSMEWELMP